MQTTATTKYEVEERKKTQPFLRKLNEEITVRQIN